MQGSQKHTQNIVGIWCERIECDCRPLLFDRFLEIARPQEHLGILIDRFSRTRIQFQRRSVFFGGFRIIASIAQHVGEPGVRLGQLRVEA